MRRLLLHAALLVTAACSGGAARTDTVRQDSARGDSAIAATDDCVRGEPQPALVAAGTTAGGPRFRRTAKLEAIEEARVDDTTSVRITHTGCAHYVQRFEFTVRGAVRDTADTRYWLEQSARYLEGLPAVEDMRPQLASMSRALQGAAAAPTPYVYDNGIQAGELSQVFLTVRNAGARRVVVDVVFDHSL